MSCLPEDGGRTVQLASAIVVPRDIDAELARIQRAFQHNVDRDLEQDRHHVPWSEARRATISAETLSRIDESTLADAKSRLDILKPQYLERFGALLNADNASELFPDYSDTLETRALLGPAVRSAAAAVVDGLYDDLLHAAPPKGKLRLVAFTAGGNGAGKSSSIPLPEETQAFIQFDSTFSSLGPSLANIERALASGFQVLVGYVWRDPFDALVRGTLPRAMRIGRTVSVVSHSRTHPGSRETVLGLLERYVQDPRVTIAVFENPAVSDDPRLVRRDEGWLRACAAERPIVLAERLRAALAAERAGGRISAAVHRGTVGSHPI